MQMTGLLQSTIRMQAAFEGSMASVERLERTRTDTSQEADYRTSEAALAAICVAADRHRTRNTQARASLDRIRTGSVAAVDVGSPTVLVAPAAADGAADEHHASLHALVALADSSETPAARRVHGWPWRGHISLRGVTMGYRPELPTVLNKLSVEIPAGKKVGIVGRTGSGKSSLLLALFRMVELRAGSILIDGVDIASVGLGDLRSRLSIIPQTPFVFAGTMRYNLDPFGEHTDAEVELALQRVGLWEAVQGLPNGIESELSEGGANLSQGQRQLVCIARAMLQNNPVLVLDEASAALDLQTDALIQQSIRTAFQHCSILTIAHRIDTVVDYDYVMVLRSVSSSSADGAQSDGTEPREDDMTESLCEFDHPYTLMCNPDSEFYKMTSQAGPTAFANLKSRAKAAYMAQ
jgi:ABC-type multidrug transport system fused ATPase/permease subunit